MLFLLLLSFCYELSSPALPLLLFLLLLCCMRLHRALFLFLALTVHACCCLAFFLVTLFFFLLLYFWSIYSLSCPSYYLYSILSLHDIVNFSVCVHVCGFVIFFAFAFPPTMTANTKCAKTQKHHIVFACFFRPLDLLLCFFACVFSCVFLFWLFKRDCVV